MACTSVKDTKNDREKDPFILLHASSQNWTAGIPSGGSGTEYYFAVKINTSDALRFDSAWIHNESFPIFLSNNNASISNEPVKIIRDDSITLRVSDLNLPNVKVTSSKPPVSFNGAALIGYTLNGKPVYFIIKEIEKLPTLHRQ